MKGLFSHVDPESFNARECGLTPHSVSPPLRALDSHPGLRGEGGRPAVTSPLWVPLSLQDALA